MAGHVRAGRRPTADALHDEAARELFEPPRSSYRGSSVPTASSAGAEATA